MDGRNVTLESTLEFYQRIFSNTKKETVKQEPTNRIVVKDSNPKPFDHRSCYGNPFKVNALSINMKDWGNGRTDRPGFAARVIDGVGEVHMFTVNGTSFESAETLFSYLRANNMRLFDGTELEILAPRDMLADKSIQIGVHSRCSLGNLRKQGIDAIDFAPTRDFDIESRLETILEHAVHYSIEDAIEQGLTHAPFEHSKLQHDSPQQSKSFGYDY